MNRDVDVAIVGAGFAGIGMGIRLARRRRESFVILERAADVGGTWRDNRYPGVACDIPSHLYSFSFRPVHDWSQLYADGAEIHDYLRLSVRDESLDTHLVLNTEMHQATWDDTTHHWLLRTDGGIVRARVLTLAMGRLSEPFIPNIPGLSRFAGPVMHTARWDPDTPMADLRVGVAGSGASAVQLVPQLARRVRRLVIFQRSAPYVIPRANRPYTLDERCSFIIDPDHACRYREQLFDEADRRVAQRFGVTPAIDEIRRQACNHLHAQVSDPHLRALLTPDYEIGCKRILLSDDYYPTLARDNVTLEPGPVASVDVSTVASVAGTRYQLDALVLATGFRTTRPSYARRIVGRGGVTLAERWREGMVAHASSAVHRFPNMFVLDGPNSGLGHNSAIHVIESQIGYVLGALDYLVDAPGSALEVTETAEIGYTADIDSASRDTVWLRGGCRSWYVDDRNGRLTLLWPGSARSFRERNGRFDPDSYRLDPPKQHRHPSTPHSVSSR